MSRQMYIPDFKSISQRQERKVRKTKFLQRAITQWKEGQTQQNLNSTCLRQDNSYMKLQVNMSKDEKELSGKRILAKGSNSCKSTSNGTQVELDLYHVKTNSYSKFHVNITKDGRENVGKLFFLQRAITPVKEGRTGEKLNLICIMSRQIHILNVRSISQRRAEKSSENRVDGHRVDWQMDRRRGNLYPPPPRFHR